MGYDLSKVEYELVLLLPSGERLFLTDACEELGWEENKGELSARLNATIRDETGDLAAKIPLCALATLFADWGKGMREVWRGTVWDISFGALPGDPVRIAMYDLMYYLHKSQANRYFAKGAGTRKILTTILAEWNVPLGRYAGPDAKHGKLLFKSKTIAQMLAEVLGDAQEKGAARSLIRAREGKADVLPYESNDEVLILSEAENVTKVSDRYDMLDMVTRVVIVGKEDKKGRPKVEATLNGKTEYGILQRIEHRGSATLGEAKAAAKKTLSERGAPARKATLECVDMPALRKGDRVYVQAGKIKSHCTVEGIAHDAARRMMRLEVKPL